MDTVSKIHKLLGESRREKPSSKAAIAGEVWNYLRYTAGINKGSQAWKDFEGFSKILPDPTFVSWEDVYQSLSNQEFDEVWKYLDKIGYVNREGTYKNTR